MPVITIYGIPDSVAFIGPYLTDKLKEEISSIAELDITPNQVTVLYPAQHPEVEVGQEIIAFVDLLDKPERTIEVRLRLANAIREIINTYCDNNKLRWESIEVFIRPLPRKNVFASAFKKKGEVTRKN